VGEALTVSEPPRIDHLQLILEFARAVFSHWVAFVSASVIAVLLWLLEGVGWISPHHWTIWTVAALGLLVAFYQAWLVEHQQVIALTGHADDKTIERKRELIRIIASLREAGERAMYWQQKTDHNWGLSRPAEKLVPDDLPGILYEAGQIDPRLREMMEEAARKLQQAESRIKEFKNQAAAFQNQQLMAQAYIELSEAVPLVVQVSALFEAFEKQLR